MRRRRRLHGWGPLLVALLLLLVLAPMVAHAQGGADTVTVTWTTPGDDSLTGSASQFDLRYSTAAITASNFASATRWNGTPVPGPSGTRQSAVVSGLTRGTTYWFAIKTGDEVPNWSNISNIARWDWISDTAPPSAPTGLTAVRQGDGTVRVSWSPNSEADLAGYEVYRALSAGGPFSVLNGALVTTTEYVDGTIPADTVRVWYQISARDETGNESGYSSAYSLSLLLQAAAWTMETGYPNPSTAGTTVRIPLVGPASGGDATMEIVNAIGQRVRRLDLGTLSPGAAEVTWDGRNDAGREVAPGVYTAWLTAGSTRVSVRLVRVP